MLESRSLCLLIVGLLLALAWSAGPANASSSSSSSSSFSSSSLPVDAPPELRALSHCAENSSISIHETLTDGLFSRLWWLGPDYDVLFVRTNTWQLYRSGDGGRSWVNQTPLLPGANDPAPTSSTPGVRTVYQVANDPNKLYILGFGGKLWVTYDKGLTYRTRVSNDAIRDIIEFISPHPSNPEWAIGASYDPRCPVLCMQLWFTSDFGNTWQSKLSGVSDFSWGRAGLPGGPPPRFMYALHWPVLSQPGSAFTAWNKVLSKTEDLWDTAPITVRESVPVMVHQTEGGVDIMWILSRKRRSDGTFRMFLRVSRDGGRFRKLRFPHTKIEERIYTILDSSPGSSFLNVKHGANDDYGTLFASDLVDQAWYTSLQYQARPAVGGSVDFAKFHGLEGIYVANTRDRKPPSGTGALKTVITYDNGAVWHNLTRAQPSSCPPSVPFVDCRLHLHGPSTSGMGRMYSVPNALGLLIGTGNEGSGLGAAAPATYLSRDAGLSWTKVHADARTYEFGDRGGLIILLEHRQQTNAFDFTWNEGEDWQRCTFSSEAVSLENVRADPNFEGNRFLFHGQRGGNGTLMLADMSRYHVRTCEGHDNPSDPDNFDPSQQDSDYEMWTPHGALGTCVLGRQVTYVRRKSRAQCFTNYTTTVAHSTSHCLCGPEDFRCDYCFRRSSESSCAWESECAEDSSTPNPQIPPAQCDQFYQAPSGFRRLHGDSCRNAEDLGAVYDGLIVIPCPRSTNISVIVVVIFVPLAMIGALVFVSAMIIHLRKKSADAASGRAPFEDEESGPTPYAASVSLREPDAQPAAPEFLGGVGGGGEDSIEMDRYVEDIVAAPSAGLGDDGMTEIDINA